MGKTLPKALTFSGLVCCIYCCTQPLWAGPKEGIAQEPAKVSAPPQGSRTGNGPANLSQVANGYLRFGLRAERDLREGTTADYEPINRDRLRYMVMGGLLFDPVQFLQVGAGISTGTSANQQDPFDTLGDEFENDFIAIQRAFVRAHAAGYWVWGGKNEFPFWQQSEYLWDADINPEGFAGGYVWQSGHNAVSFSGGGFTARHSARGLENDDFLVAGQLHGRTGTILPMDLAIGYYRFGRVGRIPGEFGDLSYKIFQLALQAHIPKVNVRVGFDGFLNGEQYDGPLPFPDQTTGLAVSVEWGAVEKQGQFFIRYSYAHIQAYAVVGYFAQDDFSPTPYTGSNFAGHEIRLGFGIGGGANLQATYYHSDSLKPVEGFKETNNRIRFDFNWRYQGSQRYRPGTSLRIGG